MTGSELKKIRLAMGLSQAGLARELKYSANAVARLERGERKISHPVALAAIYLLEKKKREDAKKGPFDDLPWKTVTAAEYDDCPHQYVTRGVDRGRSGIPAKQFDALAKLIKKHGTMRTWRGHRYRYLSQPDGMVYWNMAFIINRSLECSLENDGWPSKESQKKIRERFGKGGK
jgi:DNA-binding XRE family transcriptional regulator